MDSEIKDQNLRSIKARNWWWQCYLPRFTKAFDHNILLHKMKDFNITVKVFKWLETLLKMKQQQVRVNIHLSDQVWMLSKVSQRSVVGPLRFLILMTDIYRHTHNANFNSFADDTKIWQLINTIDLVHHLQNTVDQSKNTINLFVEL